MPPIESTALYIHFPYCVSICSYCDFDRQATGFASIPRYVESVAIEIGTQARRPIHSIYFGGGTPSLMEPAQVQRLLDAAGERFDLVSDCEITLEANPGECHTDRLAGFRRAGVNRLSIGVQSFDDATLRLLGRRHSSGEASAAVGAARLAGFDNLSLDLMLGLPGMTVTSWLANLEHAVALAPEHLSCYILTVDDRVPMGRAVSRGQLQLPTDDAVADQYLASARCLGEAGYRRYEVSNWSKPGRQSRHNLTYWRDEPYVGVGAGAAGWIDGVRTKNTPSPRRYMAAVRGGTDQRVEEERPDRPTRLCDALMLGLRLREGIDPGRFHARYGVELTDVLGDSLPELLDLGHLEWRGGRLRVSRDSILITNELLLRVGAAVEAWASHAVTGGERRLARIIHRQK